MSVARLRLALGLETRPALAWALYDCGNSVFITTALQIFPLFFAQVLAPDLAQARANWHFSLATTLGMLVIALLAPVLGAMADYARLKKPLLAGFIALGVLSTLGLALVPVGCWGWALLLFVLANVGVNGSIVFNDSLLPHVASAERTHKVASSAFALGYLGGAILFALNAAWIVWPTRFGLANADAAMRASFASVAIWWALFSLPVLFAVPEPARRLLPGEPAGLGLLPAAYGRLRSTWGEVRHFRQAALFLLAFLVYSDGIATIQRMGTMYGREIGISTANLIAAVLLLQLIAVPCTLAFGTLAGRIGAQRAVLAALATFGCVTVFGYFMRSATDFFVLAIAIGLVQGGAQALSKSIFATLVPHHKTSEFFGFFGVFEKFGGFLGPALFTVVIGATGSGRGAILGLVAFFALGALLLSRVDLVAGQRAARESEARLLQGGA